MEEGEQKNNFFPYMVNPDIDILLPKRKENILSNKLCVFKKKITNKNDKKIQY